MHTPRRSLLSSAAISVAGGLLVVVGIAGLFLPVIPGIVLLASGLALLGKQYGWARSTLTRLTPSMRPKSGQSRDTASGREAA